MIKEVFSILILTIMIQSHFFNNITRMINDMKYKSFKKHFCLIMV